MKRKTRCSVLAACAVGMSLLLGAYTTQAAEVIRDGNNATGITDLNVEGTLYDVTFIFDSAQNIYGDFPGLGDPFPFDFSDVNDAVEAINAVNASLSAAGILGVTGQSSQIYNVPYTFTFIPFTGQAAVGSGGVTQGGSNWVVDPAAPNSWEWQTAFAYARFELADGSPPPPPPANDVAIAASSLPSSRSVQVGSLASVFATIINGAGVTATDCSIAPATGVAANFAYQTTDASNAPTGSPNTPADIPANGSQNFIFGFVPTGPISPTEVFMTYDCTNSANAPVAVGLNTLLLSAEATPVPDIVALAATPTGDGILNLPGTNGANAFAVSSVNVGSTATITATPKLSTPLPVALSICETNPGTGVCLSAAGPSATSSVGANATSTYSVFVGGAGTVPFDPAANRIIVEFRDGGNVVRGSTSVAVRTQ